MTIVTWRSCDSGKVLQMVYASDIVSLVYSWISRE